MKTTIAIWFSLMVLGQSMCSGSIQVIFQGNAIDSFGTGLPNNNQVWAGFFDKDQSWISANANNLSELFNNGQWQQFATAKIDSTGGLPPALGNFTQDIQGDLSPFGGNFIYLWVFKTQDQAAPNTDNVLEYGLFYNPSGGGSDPAWIFPNSELPGANYIAIASDDEGITTLFGSLSGGSFQLAPIPEPAAYGFLAGAGLLAFIFFRWFDTRKLRL